MIIDLEDFIENDILYVSVFGANYYLIIKRDFNDFILVNSKDYTYSKIDRIHTDEELEILGIFPRKGAEIYNWSDYKQLINDKNNEEVIKPF